MDALGTIAVVTGGASGLGEATARTLADRGARLAVLDVDESRLEEIAADLGALALRVDVTDEAAMARAFDDVAAQLGVPRILVNCAGVAGIGQVVGGASELTTSRIRRILEVNVVGTFNAVQPFVASLKHAPAVLDGERGAIVNTASVSAFDGVSGQSAYGAAKGGVAAMTLALARELGPDGIRVVAVAPGLFETPMARTIPDYTWRSIIAGVPFPHRAGRPQEFAHLVATIVENQMLNGEVIRLDGAARLQDPPRAG